MIEKIYLDMDGVLCYFEERYFELYGQTPGEARDRKNFSENWTNFIMTRQFETLPWFPGGEKLVRFVKCLGVPIEILSSSGGEKYHSEVWLQKDAWLTDKGIKFKRNIVAGRKLKRDYATPNTVLIDDTPDVIEAFNAAGGIGILHKDVDETIQALKLLFPAEQPEQI